YTNNKNIVKSFFDFAKTRASDNTRSASQKETIDVDINDRLECITYTIGLESFYQVIVYENLCSDIKKP
ncbi:hypothetical protein CR513_56811, partial [Mucuna pruriens]